MNTLYGLIVLSHETIEFACICVLHTLAPKINLTTKVD